MSAYMGSVLYMLDHGVYFSPAAVPEQISFGHPLFLLYSLALIAQTFGYSVELMHSTMLLIAVAFNIGTFLLVFRLFKNYAVACITMLIFMIQPLVIAQSTLVLLDLFIGFCSVYAILFYLNKKYLLASLFTTMALLTKETGLVLSIAIISHGVIDFYFNKNKTEFLKKSLIALMPFIAFAWYFQVQKNTYGWYFNPLNMGATNLTLKAIIQKFWDYPIEIIFYDQGRIFLTVVTLIASILAIKNKTFNFKLKYNSDLILIGVFVFGFTLFSCINNALERYFIVMFPFAFIIFGFGINYFKKFHKLLPVLILTIGLFISYRHLFDNKKFTDINFSFKKHIEANDSLLNYLNSGAFEKDTIGIFFPLHLSAFDKRIGYLDSFRFNRDILFTPNLKYYTYIKPGNFNTNPPDTSQYELYKSFENDISKAMLYINKSRK